MHTAIVLFTRDLRVHDQPALAAAAETAEHVVPLFVFDPGVLERFGAPNRAAFLLDALRNLARSLRERGGGLAVREGGVVVETMRVAAETGAATVFVSEDVSAYAQAREQRLQRACDERRIELRVLPGITVIPPGELAPARADYYRVFTPYWRQWRSAPHRPLEPAPRKIVLPSGLRKGRLPALADLAPGPPSPDLPRGGESEARRRLERFLENGVSEYGRLHDDLAADATSRLSPYLHFGCLSALEIAERADERAGSGTFVRQLCWRDFYTQLLAARPETSREDYRDRGDRWRDDEQALAAWKDGRTGYPIVDAGMRQLAREGYMHNRARLLVASFLTKDLYLDWRLGAAHFFDLLVDGDVANNVGNWQWVAGTGVDTRPNRIFNPTVQAKRLDPNGDYVRRYVPELAEVEGIAIHEPWKLGLLRPADYPEPIVDHVEAVRRFRAARSGEA
ncbi:MAG: deoxyribodipyrimidine photo-lyase [Actinobacteria bacterium]|nr:deoxyribodipyrimidine photo-lyase [Actinomycetota bacterium]